MICQLCFEEEAIKDKKLCQKCKDAIEKDDDMSIEELIEKIK